MANVLRWDIMNRSRIRNLALLYFAADFVAIVSSYYTTLLIRFNVTFGEPIFFTWINRTLGIRPTGAVGDEFKTFYIISGPRIIFFLVVTICVIYALWDLYEVRRYIKKRPIAWHVIVSNVAALAIFYTYFYLRRNVFHPRSMFATMLFLNCVYCCLYRALVDHWLGRLRERRQFDIHPVVVIGGGREAEELERLMPQLHSQGLYVRERLAWPEEAPFEDVLRSTEAVVRREHAEMVILAEPRVSVHQVMQFLELADKLDIAVKILSREFDILLTRARIGCDIIQGIPALHFSPPSRARQFQGIKRCASFVLAACMLLLLAPVMLIIAGLIRLTSRGAAMFVQERMGVNRQPFRMYKFRTMHEHADEVRAQVEEFNESGGGLFKMRRDPRVTRMGRFLRRYSLDELPQLINIMRREMTLVGPRPLPREDFANYYEEWHYGRHNGLPGLTCLWQVSGRSDLDFHSMCILDLYYLRNQTWALDLKILLRTAWVVLFAKGAY